MNNKTLYITIIVLLLVIVGGGAYLLGSRQRGASNLQPPSSPEFSAPVTASPSTNPNLSEQPNQAKFNEYFFAATLVNIPVGTNLGPGMTLTKATSFDFSAGDRFCTSLDVKKSFSANIFSEAIYDTNAKTYVIPRRTPGGPSSVSTGNTVGCQDLMVGPSTPILAGKYEYKIYLDNTLVAVLPFEVK